MSQVFVDLDGVLANFNKACCQTFGLDYPKETILWHTWPHDVSGKDLDTWFNVLTDDPDLWTRIEPFPWTPAIVQVLDLHTPGWKILTTATQDPACWGGKAAWVTQRLFMRDSLHRLVIVGGHKWELMSPGSVLVDNDLRNVTEWQKQGGHAFLWKEFTEDMVQAAMNQIEQLRLFLAQVATR